MSNILGLNAQGLPCHEPAVMALLGALCMQLPASGMPAACLQQEHRRPVAQVGVHPQLQPGQTCRELQMVALGIRSAPTLICSSMSLAAGM